jgi:hypothetical protein
MIKEIQRKASILNRFPIVWLRMAYYGILRHPITLVPADLYNLLNGNPVLCRQHKTGIFGFQRVQEKMYKTLGSLRTEKLRLN